MEREIESRGFKHDISPGAPICRWVLDQAVLDVMPSERDILGFHNRWYPLVVKTAKKMALANGRDILVITAPLFIATKFEAFHGRGNSDYLASHDLEDLLTVIDGRPELLGEIKDSNDELRNYLALEMDKLLAVSDFQLALPGHFPGDAASQARVPELMRRMRLIARIGS